MSAYRISAANDAPALQPPRKTRTPVVLAISAFLHVAILGASALMTPREPPPPRVVDVMKWEAVQLDNGEMGWRSEGLHKARVRGE